MSLEHMLWVFKHSKAEYGARLTMLALAEHANEHDVSYPAVPTIASKTLLSDRQVQRNLRQLVASGELEELAAESPYGTKQYRLTMPVPGGDILSPGGDISDRGGVTSATENVSQMSPEPKPEPKPENHSAREAQGALLPDPVDEVWEHYVKALDRPRAQLSSKVRKWIAEAIQAVGVDETKRAVSGLAASEFHRQKGFVGIEYAIRPKQNETLEGRIAMMASKAGAVSRDGRTTVAELLATVPSEAHDIVRSRMSNVIAATHSDRPSTQRAAEDAKQKLRDNPPHIEPVYGDEGKVTGWRRVSGR